MANAESLRQITHTRAPFSAWLGVALMFALFGAIVLAIIGPSPRSDEYESKRAKARVEKLKALRDEETKALGGYGWVDKTKGVARVPIERAMQLTIADLSQKKPAPAGPIAAQSPTVAAAAPAAASPAPKPSPTPTGTPKPIAIEGPHSEAGGQPAAAVNPPPAAQSPITSPPPRDRKSTT